MISMICYSCGCLTSILDVHGNVWQCQSCGERQVRSAKYIVDSYEPYTNVQWLHINAAKHTVQKLVSMCTNVNDTTIKAFLDKHNIQYMDVPDDDIASTVTIKADPLIDGFQDNSIVYIIQASNGYVKIGRSHYPERRLEVLQSHSPLLLKLLHTIKSDRYGGNQMELFLHMVLKQYHVHHEWFNLPDKVLTNLRRLNGENFHDLVQYWRKS